MTTTEVGRLGEDAASAFLLAEGYRIEERNAYRARGEIDIVAFDGPTLCFIEVRARSDDAFGGALASIGAAKRRHLVRAASVLLQRYQDPPRARFDVVVVDLSTMACTLHRAAFTADG